jgi:hypothetical protein
MNVLPSRTQAKASRIGKRALVSAFALTSALLVLTPARLHSQSHNAALPDAPSALLAVSRTPRTEAASPSFDGLQQTTSQTQQNSTGSRTGTQPLPPLIAAPSPQPAPLAPLSPKQQQAADRLASASLPPCPRGSHTQLPIIFLPQTGSGKGCQQQDQLQLIVDTGNLRPLTPTDKGILAVRAVTDPFNLLTIVAFSGISVAADAHSDYGPGFRGWGRLIGYSLAEDIQGEFTGTFALPVIFHEDPRYHRLPGRPLSRRIEHALIHTIVSQHDDGSLMLNYATLINYPLSAEISNLYVPGLPTNAPSTAKRIAIGYATDPVGPLVAEFLPDLAKRVHIHIVFAQQILNRIALGNNNAANAPL